MNKKAMCKILQKNTLIELNFESKKDNNNIIPLAKTPKKLIEYAVTPMNSKILSLLHSSGPMNNQISARAPPPNAMEIRIIQNLKCCIFDSDNPICALATLTIISFSWPISFG